MTTLNLDLIALRSYLAPGDESEVRRLAVSSGFFNAAEEAIAEELVAEARSRGHETSGYWFVFADGAQELAGYACWGPIDGTAWSYDLFWIVVDPQLQGQGLGRLLIRESESQILAHARAAGQIKAVIWVETSSTSKYQPTRTFYECRGYHEACRLRAFYGPEDDKVMFTKILEKASV